MINTILRILRLPLTGNRRTQALISILFACATGLTGAEVQRRIEISRAKKIQEELMSIQLERNSEAARVLRLTSQITGRNRALHFVYHIAPILIRK